MNFIIITVLFTLTVFVSQAYANEPGRNSTVTEYQNRPATTRRPTQNLALFQRPLLGGSGNFLNSLGSLLGNLGSLAGLGGPGGSGLLGGSGGSGLLGGSGLFGGSGLLGGSGGSGLLGGSGGSGLLGGSGGSGLLGGSGGSGLLGGSGGLGSLFNFGNLGNFGGSNSGGSSSGGSDSGSSNSLGLSNLFEGATSRLNEVLGTMTGVLAAVGGGYLLYVAMVAAYGNVLGQQYHLAGHRSSENFFEKISSLDYPELVFDWLKVEDEQCKTKMVCQLHSFLSQNGLPAVALDGLSRKIPGMKKYIKAARRGAKNQSCHNSCPLSFTQIFLRAFGFL
ncbi:uncharacterized protein LOC111632861 [Centruroides sculpturatus]|uniref:uncharacterized protein LOC111632861 n=1 Tax=Centruroides sculpturatus TaxID=218467 RepID=UPI000C6D6703|nr:uncharacterized protein LOC111632861 [Centruroides sculpturatus]